MRLPLHLPRRFARWHQRTVWRRRNRSAITVCCAWLFHSLLGASLLLASPALVVVTIDSLRKLLHLCEEPLLRRFLLGSSSSLAESPHVWLFYAVINEQYFRVDLLDAITKTIDGAATRVGLLCLLMLVVYFAVLGASARARERRWGLFGDAGATWSDHWLLLGLLGRSLWRTAILAIPLIAAIWFLREFALTVYYSIVSFQPPANYRSGDEHREFARLSIYAAPPLMLIFAVACSGPALRVYLKLRLHRYPNRCNCGYPYPSTVPGERCPECGAPVRLMPHRLPRQRWLSRSHRSIPLLWVFAVVSLLLCDIIGVCIWSLSTRGPASRASAYRLALSGATISVRATASGEPGLVRLFNRGRDGTLVIVAEYTSQGPAARCATTMVGDFNSPHFSVAGVRLWGLGSIALTPEGTEDLVRLVAPPKQPGVRLAPYQSGTSKLLDTLNASIEAYLVEHPTGQ